MTVYNENIMNIWEAHVHIVLLIATLQVNKQLFLPSYSLISPDPESLFEPFQTRFAFTKEI